MFADFTKTVRAAQWTMHFRPDEVRDAAYPLHVVRVSDYDHEAVVLGDWIVYDPGDQVEGETWYPRVMGPIEFHREYGRYAAIATAKAEVL